jgi:hypothetical protein
MGRPGGGEHEAVERITDWRKRVELQRLRSVEAEDGVAGVAGDRLENLRRADAQAAPFVEHRDLDKSDHRHMAQPSSGIDGRKGATRSTSEPSWIREMPDDGLRISDDA